VSAAQTDAIEPITVTWSTVDRTPDGAPIGRINVGGEFWAAVEWSEKRQAWCIEDACGECLAHASSLVGQAASRDEAVALALAMIADGRMRTPQQACEHRREVSRREREKRQARPSEQRRAAERAQRRKAETQAYRAEWKARSAEAAQQPLWEVLHETFDFADPDLWRSNSFASLRPRLVLHLEAAVAKLESERCYHASRGSSRRASEYAIKEAAQIDAKLARAKAVLLLLKPEGGAHA
jgi:hypothetical protein